MRRALLAGLLCALAPAPATAQVVPFPDPSARPAPAPPPVSAPGAAGTEAITVGQDAAHSHSSAEPSLKAPLSLLWSAHFSSAVQPGVLVAGGRVYVAHPDATGNEGVYLEALEASSGRRLWSAQFAADYGHAALAYGDGKVFSVDRQAVRAFDASTGASVWSAEGSDDVAPVVVGDTLYVQGGNLRAYATSDGSLRYSVGLDGGGSGSAAIAGDRLFTRTGCTDFAFDRLTGARIWAMNPNRCSGGGGATPTLYRDRVTFPGASTGVDSRAAADGAPLSAPALRLVDGDVGIADPRASGQRQFPVLDLLTGEKLWSVGGGSFVGLPESLVAVSTQVAKSADEIRLSDLRTGRLQWSARIAGEDRQGEAGVPSVGNGILVVPSGKNLLALAHARPGTGDQLSLRGRRFTDAPAGQPLTVRGDAGRRLVPRRVKLRTVPRGGGRSRTLDRAHPLPTGRFRAHFAPRRNVRVRATAAGYRRSRPHTLFAYPSITASATQSGGLVRDRVGLRKVRGLRRHGRRIAEYFGRGRSLRRLGSTRLDRRGRGTISFAPLRDVRRGDRIYRCLVGAPKLRLGRRNRFTTGCGRRRLRL